MLIRYYSEADFEAVKSLHAKQGLEYTLPDLESPTMLVRSVIEEGGEITHAAFLRKTAEAYWIFDPKQVNRERLGRLLLLHKELLRPALQRGLEDVHCFLPPDIEPRFGKLMMHMGWRKPTWPCYFMSLEDQQRGA